MSHALPARVWSAVRYQRLLPLATRRRSYGRSYARIVAMVEWLADRRRRDVATSRIARWLGMGRIRAGLLYRSCLESEAREEADTSWFITHPDDLERAYCPIDSPDRDGAATIWVTLHLGSPILAYLHLSRAWGIDAKIIGRALDDENPMPAAKQVWGRRKVAWIETLTAKPFLGVDALSIVRGREHLLRGGSLFAAIDVPGDIVGRSAKIELFGESMRIAGGIMRMATLARVPVRFLIAVSDGTAIKLRYGDAIPPSPTDAHLVAIGSEIEATLRAFPEEWWLWPYLPSFGE